MIESAAYHIIKKEGYAEGRTAGHEEGLQKGLEQGLERGLEQGLQKGRDEAIRDNARNLLLLGILTDEQIAQATGLSLEEILALKKETKK